MSEPIFRIKLYEDVANHMRERISSRQWQGGDRLPPEAELAKEFDVSRSTVREAIRSLQIAGLLRSRAGSGTFVTEQAPMILQTGELARIMSAPEHLQALVQARYLLEPQLAALAAKQADQGEKHRLCQMVQQMAQLTERWDLMTAGHSFHMELARMSHNAVLYGFYQSAHSQLRSMRVLDSLTVEIYRAGVQEHGKIAQAVLQGDGAEAARLMKAHLKADYAAYLKEEE